MKTNKKRHGKKSYSFRRKKARTQTSSSVSSDATFYMVLSPSKQHHRCSGTVSCVSVPSNSRSSSVRKKATGSYFILPLESHSEEKLKSIAFYIDNREEMVRHMFSSLHRRELYDFLPKNLKELKETELRYLCLKELNGRDFIESSQSEGEKDQALITNGDIKKSKTEVAIADSTTEMTEPNLLWMRQENETAVQSDFTIEHGISLSSNQHAEVCTSNEVSDLDYQVAADVTLENDEDLEDGEIVSDQEKSSSSSKDDALNKDQNCSQHFAIHSHLLNDSAHDGSSSQSMPKNSGILCSSGNSTNATNKIREERRLHMLELELRARAIEALIRRSDK